MNTKAHVVVVGLANDYLGYIVNEAEYAHGGYEVDARSYYGPGLGTFMAEKAAATAHILRASVSEDSTPTF